MAKCSFCSREVDQGRGIMFVTAEGKIINFCSRKCRKAWHMNRSPRKLGWVRKKKK